MWRPPVRDRIERRAASFGPVPLNDTHTLFGNYPMTSTGIRVDNYSADCNYVFRRGVEVIAQSLAKICSKWKLRREDAEGQKTDVRDANYRLMTRAPNGYTTAYSFWELVQSWAKGWGNGYAWILRQNDLTPIGLYPLHPSRVSPRLVRGSDPTNPWELVYWIDGGREFFLPYEILHIKGNPGFDGVTGYNLVQLHENVLAIAQAQNEYTGEFYANAAAAGGLVELPSHLKPDVVLKYQKDFQDRYSSRGNRHKLALVDSGVKFTQTTIDPQDAQLLESRKFSIYEIAMMLGVPPTVLGDLSHGTFNNTEQQQIALNTLTIHPIAESWRQELNTKLTPAAEDGTECGWCYEAALKSLDAADTNTRTTYLKTAIGGPWMSPEEGREEDGLPQEIKGTIYPPPNMTRKDPAEGGGRKAEGGDASAGDEGANGEPRGARANGRVERRSEPNPQSPIPNPSSLAARQTIGETMEPVFRDVLDRLTTKEAKAVGGLTKHIREGHPDVFERKVGEFYDKHQGNVEQSFTPALSTLNKQIRKAVHEERADGDMNLSDDTAAGLYAQKLAGRHVEHAKQAIAAILTGEQDAAKAADAIDARMADWQKKKPAGEAGYEIRQAHNFLAREAYRAAGCKGVRWVYHPGDGEECRGLNEKIVGIDQPFQEEPKRMHPPLNRECRCGIMGVFGPEHRFNANHDERGLFAADAGGAAGGGPGDPSGQSSVPVEISGNEMGISDWRAPGAWRKAYDWAKPRFAGKTFVNQETGMAIQVSTAGLKKTASHMPDAKPMKALAKLPQILETSSYDHSESPKGKAGSIRQFHYLRTGVNLEGTPHDVKIVVREDNNGHWFYDHHLTEQKRPV
jgi:HK97 family phage portal protein